MITRCEITELSRLLFSLYKGLPKKPLYKPNVAEINSINLNRYEKQCYYGDHNSTSTLFDIKRTVVDKQTETTSSTMALTVSYKPTLDKTFTSSIKKSTLIRPYK